MIQTRSRKSANNRIQRPAIPLCLHAEPFFGAGSLMLCVIQTSVQKPLMQKAERRVRKSDKFPNSASLAASSRFPLETSLTGPTKACKKNSEKLPTCPSADKVCPRMIYED